MQVLCGVLCAMIVYILAYKCCDCILTGQDHRTFKRLDTRVAVDSFLDSIIKKKQTECEPLMMKTTENLEVSLPFYNCALEI